MKVTYHIERNHNGTWTSGLSDDHDANRFQTMAEAQETVGYMVRIMEEDDASAYRVVVDIEPDPCASCHDREAEAGGYCKPCSDEIMRVSR